MKWLGIFENNYFWYNKMVPYWIYYIKGSSIKLLVKYLKIQLAGKNDRFRLFLEFNHGMIDNLSQGIEDLCGYKNYSWIVSL